MRQYQQQQQEQEQEQEQQEPQQQPGPESIDFAAAQMARRRHVRELISMICTGIVVTVMVVTFYRILSS